MKSVDVVIRGLVQGVGYRWSGMAQAQQLGVIGLLRNEPDGSVFGHFEGEDEAVDALVEWCWQGPSMARVKSVTVTAAAPQPPRKNRWGRQRSQFDVE